MYYKHMFSSGAPSVGPSPLLADSLPIYARIAATLRARIELGSYIVGSLLPSIDALMKEFSAARATVRQAIGQLKQEGLIKSERGAGTCVLRRPTSEQRRKLPALWGDLVLRQTELSRQLLSFTADAPVTGWEAYQFAFADHYVQMRSVHVLNDRAYCLVDVLLAADVYSLAPVAFKKKPAICVLDTLPNVALTSAKQVLTVGIADLPAAQVLDIPSGSPVARIHRYVTDKTGRAIYLAVIDFPPREVALEMDLFAPSTTHRTPKAYSTKSDRRTQ